MFVVDAASGTEGQADAVDGQPIMAANFLKSGGRRSEVHVILGMHLKPAHRRKGLKDLRHVGAAQSDACDRGERGGRVDRHETNLSRAGLRIWERLYALGSVLPPVSL